VVVVFLAGGAIGLALFSSVLDWLLRTRHDIVLAVLIGLMVGSLRVVWPWPEGTDSAALGAPVAGEWPAALLLAVAGAVVVLALARLASARTA
jgi:putative membrane protein